MRILELRTSALILAFLCGSAQATESFNRSFDLNIFPLIGANLLEDQGGIDNYAAFNFTLFEVGGWTIGPAFHRLLQTTTRGFGDNTTGKDLTRYYDLGLRAFWHPISNSGLYVSPGLFYRWAMVQFWKESVVERANSPAGLALGAMIGYEAQVDGPISWRTGLGVSWDWIKDKTLKAQTFAASTDLARGLRMDLEFSLIFRF